MVKGFLTCIQTAYFSRYKWIYVFWIVWWDMSRCEEVLWLATESDKSKGLMLHLPSFNTM